MSSYPFLEIVGGEQGVVMRKNTDRSRSEVESRVILRLDEQIQVLFHTLEGSSRIYEQKE